MDGATHTQLLAVLRLMTAVLGEDAIGAYLHGSAVLGGLRPDSDLDVLVVAHRSLQHEERMTVLDGLLDVSGSRARRTPGRPVELTCVVRDAVQPWSYPPREDFLYGEWLRNAYEAGAVPQPRANPDLAILMHTVVADGQAVLGPRAETVLDPVPSEDLLRAVAAGVPELLDNLGSDTRNVLLTLARAWMTLATGEVTSKDRAAYWVLPRLCAEHRPLMSLARAAYLGHREDDWEQQREHLDALGRFLAQQIAACPSA